MTSVSSLSKKFELLQERAQRRVVGAADRVPPGSPPSNKRPNIEHLKEFYLDRLAKKEPDLAARLETLSRGARSQRGEAQPQASGQHVAKSSQLDSFRPRASGPVKDIEELEVMCNNCYNLIRSSEAANCTGTPSDCPIALRSPSGTAAGGAAEQNKGAESGVRLMDMKLQRLRAALEARLQDSSSKVNVMRHLTQLRYHIDTALKWTETCSDIGALSDHSVQQVKQLTATSRVLAPAVYVFSKRIENVVIQKERELRRLQSEASTRKSSKGDGFLESGNLAEFRSSYRGMAREGIDGSRRAVSVVSEMDSDCGTQYAETILTQDQSSPQLGTMDVGNVDDANDYLNLRNEDAKRRWFYSQCLTVKLACPDKVRARKTLISDLYARVRAEDVPIEGWVRWIRNELMPEGGTTPTASSAAEAALMATQFVPPLESPSPAVPASASTRVERATALPAAAVGAVPAEGSNFTPSARASALAASPRGRLGPGAGSRFVLPGRRLGDKT